MIRANGNPVALNDGVAEVQPPIAAVEVVGERMGAEVTCQYSVEGSTYERIATETTQDSVLFTWEAELPAGSSITIQVNGSDYAVLNVVAQPVIAIDGATVEFNDRNECYVAECDEIQVTNVEGANVQAFYYQDIDESEGVALTRETIPGGGVQFVNRGNPWGDSTYNAVKLFIDGVEFVIRVDAAYVDRIITNQGVIDFTEEDPSVPAPLTSVVVEGVNFKGTCQLIYRDGSFVRIQPTLATDTRLEFYLTPALDPTEAVEVRIEATAVYAASFMVTPQS